MRSLEKVLEAHINLIGVVPLTNLELFKIIRQASRQEYLKRDKEERWLDQLTAECTDPNG